MHLSRYTAGAVLALAVLTGLPATAPAQDMAPAPTYSRLRMGAEDWSDRGGMRGFGHGMGGYGSGYGYFQPYVSPVIVGSWYERPYPYHFDYFRDRWAGARTSTVTSDCPCAEPPVATDAPEAEADAAAAPAY